ncbi:MAG: DUF47 family protein [Candidatus Omnitrophica bacterium]|nr:DUF47 family protein [Candidatus Omnitrophota bacterium]
MARTHNILAWLGEREEKKILSDALTHVAKSLSCVREVKKALDCLAQGDLEGKNKAIAVVKQAEHEGDEIRRIMMEELSRGLLLPPDREDLLFLNEALNDIADNSKGVARLLEFVDQPLISELMHNIQDNSLLAVKAAESLEQAITSLVQNEAEKVLESCARIETLEEEGDDRKRELMALLLKSDLSGPRLLIIYEIIDTLEEMIDSIDRAGDLVRILAVKSR